MQTIANSGIDAVTQLLSEYLEKRSVEGTLSWLTEDIQWIGTSAFEEAYCKEDVKKLLIADMKSIPTPFQTKVNAIREVSLSETTPHVFLRMTAMDNNSLMLVMEMRVSLACRKDKNCYKISALHASVANSLQQDGEFFPVSFAEEKLKQKLSQQNTLYKALLSNMPGGVAIFQNKHPIRLAHFNDAVCSMVGQSREEFKRKPNMDFAINFTRKMLQNWNCKCNKLLIANPNFQISLDFY